MKRIRIDLCDRDHLYRGRLHGFLKERLRLPVTWREYSDRAGLPVEDDMENRLLVIDAAQADGLSAAGYAGVLVLTEEAPDAGHAPVSDGNGREVVRYLSRYVRASEIAGVLLEMLAQSGCCPEDCGSRAGEKTYITAYYSPLGRCMQTSMAIASGQIIGNSMRAFYLGFDAFPVSAFTGEAIAGDLADLLYAAGCAPGTLPLQIERIKRSIGPLYYIPPAHTVHSIAGTDGKELLSLIRAICAGEAPDVLLLDLTSQVPGLFDLLGAADEVITVTGHDKSDFEKTSAYKRWLADSGMEHILEKTRFVKLPAGCTLPHSYEALGNSRLGAYVRQKGLLPGKAAR